MQSKFEIDFFQKRCILSMSDKTYKMYKKRSLCISSQNVDKTVLKTTTVFPFRVAFLVILPAPDAINRLITQSISRFHAHIPESRCCPSYI